MNITTNRKPRFLLDWHDLTERERKEFDYIDEPEANGSARFFRYMGRAYDTHEFTRSPVKGWDGCAADSYFSGVVIKFVRDERIVVGTYYS